MSVATHPELDGFARDNALDGLTEKSLRAVAEGREGYTVEKAKRFLEFQTRIDAELLKHPIITDNTYTAWFEHGRQSHEQLVAFIVQFSVFSNQFLVAQLQKTLNADTLEGMRASKEILANEIGVVFNAPGKKKTESTDTEREGDPELVSTEGSVDGGVFRFRAAHFEWLLRIAEKLGLAFEDMGRRIHGTESTLFFCDELIRLYGSEDYMTSQAASYAVENWAAAGFWDELVTGFVKYNETIESPLPLAFFTWHARIEGQHAAHTQEELEELYFDRDVDEDAFIETGNEMLGGVAAFWNGLDEQRRRIAAI
jgi:pyrroloquinoline quinone (PQQ) biosynthesis protein C